MMWLRAIPMNSLLSKTALSQNNVSLLLIVNPIIVAAWFSQAWAGIDLQKVDRSSQKLYLPYIYLYIYHKLCIVI